jgi:hypothetical protein
MRGGARGSEREGEGAGLVFVNEKKGLIVNVNKYTINV